MRRRGQAWAVGLLALLIAVSCNPLEGEQTKPGPPGSDASWSGSATYTGTEGGWLQTRIRDGGDVDLDVRVNLSPAEGTSKDRECFTDGAGGVSLGDDCGPGSDPWYECPFSTPSRAAWHDGESLGYRDMIWVEPGDWFDLRVGGSPNAVVFDLRVVDDDGQRVGDLEYVGGVGLPLC
jgi:hypothetical protein